MLCSRGHVLRRFVAEGARFALDGDFHVSNLTGLRGGKQIFLAASARQLRSSSNRARFSPQNIGAAYKRQCGQIVDRCLQIDARGTSRSQAVFGGGQQLRTYSGPARLRQHVNRDEMPGSRDELPPPKNRESRSIESARAPWPIWLTEADSATRVNDRGWRI